MHCAIVSDTYSPDTNSAANLLSDFVNYSKNNYELSFDIFTVGNSQSFCNEKNISILRYEKDLKKKSNSIRAILEFFSGIYFCYLYLKERRKIYYDAVIYYNPTILQICFIIFLRFISPKAVFILILRDIFPDWAVEIGLIKSKILKLLFTKIKKFNIQAADIVYCESINKLQHVRDGFPATNSQLLYNWTDFNSVPIELAVSDAKKFIYAGNVGPAQNISSCVTFLNLITKAGHTVDFYADGRELGKLRKAFKHNDLVNFFELISQESLENLLPKYDGGLVFLAQDLLLDNVPGKVLTYLRHGLPVFGAVNTGSELISLIEKNNLGALVDNREFLNSIEYNNLIVSLCNRLKRKKIYENASMIFGVEMATKRIFDDVNRLILEK
jgi:glycosyltransferase involved in cell wall biosynthesis